MPFGQYSLLTQSKIQSLQPPVQALAVNLLDTALAQGIPLEIVQGLRTPAEQQALYEQGQADPTKKVTNAPALSSYHNFGLAFDVVPKAYLNLPNWNPSGPLWNQIGAIGEGLGLGWGGRFSTPDKPHFEFKAAPLSELKAYWMKFKEVMPISVTPTIGAGAIIIGIGLFYWFILRPMLHDAKML